MIKLSVFEFFCRCIPEAFVFVFASLLFTKEIINRKTLFISSITYAVIVYLVRLLPIHFGVHRIIISIFYVVISVLINHISINKSIFCILIEFILLLTCELLNLFMLDWLDIDIRALLGNPVKKVLYFLPSLILFSCTIILSHMVFYRNRRAYVNIQK